MSERTLEIDPRHVSKQYRLGAIGAGTLPADLRSWFARLRGKEDPNRKIGDTSRMADTNTSSPSTTSA